MEPQDRIRHALPPSLNCLIMTQKIIRTDCCAPMLSQCKVGCCRCGTVIACLHVLQAPQMRKEILNMTASGQLQWVIQRRDQQHQQLPVKILTHSLGLLCFCCLCRAGGMLQPVLSF